MTRIERIQPSLHKKDRVLVYLTGGRLLRSTPEELLTSRHPLPSSNVSAQNWFALKAEADEHNLFSHSDSILANDSLPYLAGDVTAQKQWLAEYTSVKTSAAAAAVGSLLIVLFGKKRIR